MTQDMVGVGRWVDGWGGGVGGGRARGTRSKTVPFLLVVYQVSSFCSQGRTIITVSDVALHTSHK